MINFLYNAEYKGSKKKNMSHVYKHAEIVYWHTGLYFFHVMHVYLNLWSAKYYNFDGYYFCVKFPLTNLFLCLFDGGKNGTKTLCFFTITGLGLLLPKCKRHTRKY